MTNQDGLIIKDKTMKFNDLIAEIENFYKESTVKNFRLENCSITDCPKDMLVLEVWYEYKQKKSIEIFGVKVSVEWGEFEKNKLFGTFHDAEKCFIFSNNFYCKFNLYAKPLQERPNNRER